MVKILACGICSTTDSELIRGTQPYHDHYPCVLGHEAIGEIVEIGAGVTNFKPGDWVTRPTALFPGTMRDGLSSAWGGFAQLGVVRDQAAMCAAGDHSMGSDYTALRQNVVPREMGLQAAVLSIALAETLSWRGDHAKIHGSHGRPVWNLDGICRPTGLLHPYRGLLHRLAQTCSW